MNCVFCLKEFKPQSKKYLEDGLCSFCRKKQKQNIDNQRKTKICSCGKRILKTSSSCSSCSQLGKQNHQWKEIKQDRGIYTKREWKIWRISVIKRDSYKCKLCGETRKLHAHHIVPKRKDQSKVFDIENGITLCSKCHSKVHLKEINYIPSLLALI